MLNDDGRWKSVQKNRINEYLSELNLDQLDIVIDCIEDIILKNKTL